MKEFIEKLIGKLEEYKYSHLVERDSEMLEHCKEKEDDDCYLDDCFACVWDKAIEIVNQLAEEYKQCTLCYLGIPCEYQNPEISCEKCIEYDTEEHCCPKFCKVITDTIQEMKEENNNGWITDRNPTKEECGEYGHAEFQVTIPQSKGNKTITMDFVYETVRGKEVARWKWCGRLPVWEVLAWKPLDAPYQPKGE